MNLLGAHSAYTRMPYFPEETNSTDDHIRLYVISHKIRISDGAYKTAQFDRNAYMSI